MELPEQTDAPRWLPLGDAAEVFAMPVNSAIIYAARARADAMLVQAIEAGQVVSKAGGHVTGLPDLTDEVEQNGVWSTLYCLALAELTVSDWRGVTVRKEAVPFRADGLARLLSNAHAADAFVRQQVGRQNQVVAEGNV